MADAGPEQAAPLAGPGGAVDDKTLALAVYVLYLLGLMTGGITAVVGVVLAYLNKDAAPDWLRSHFIFQIRTFWIALAGCLVAAATVWALGLGVLIGFLTVIWFAVRCAFGLNRLFKAQAYPTPQSWTV